MASEKVQQLQLLQQNLQSINAQQQQLQDQALELESAASELKASKKAYRIIGNLMIEDAPEKIIKGLNEKLEMVNMRLKNFNESEEKLKKNINLLQKEVILELKVK